jgi:hypothetical protein
MKTAATASILALANATCGSWTTVTVDPPATACCTTAWDSNTCNVLQDAADAAAECTIFELMPGTYCNKDYWKNYSSNTFYRNQALLKVNGKNNLQWIA